MGSSRDVGRFRAVSGQNRVTPVAVRRKYVFPRLALLLLLLWPAAGNAQSVTIGVGTPTSAGSVVIKVEGSTPGAPDGTDGQVHPTIPLNATATQKAALIASAINTGSAPATATSSGSTVTVTPLLFGDLDAVEILSDQTGESNTLSIQSTGAVSVRYVPSSSPPATIPPNGLSFFPFVGIGGQTKPAPITANGILTDPQIQNLMFQTFGQSGINFTSATDPISGESLYLAPLPATGFTGGAQPATGAPQSYSITWDANTSQYIGNFGLQIQSAPEPTTLLIPATLLLWVSRRARRRR